MFLKLLSRNEKENFLELAHYIAESDDYYAETEKRWIEKIKRNLGMTDYEPTGKPFDQIMDELKDSSVISKASILLDILALTMADHSYRTTERNIIKKIRNRWDISDEQYRSIIFWMENKDQMLKAEGLEE